MIQYRYSREAVDNCNLPNLTIVRDDNALGVRIWRCLGTKPDGSLWESYHLQFDRLRLDHFSQLAEDEGLTDVVVEEHIAW